MSLDEVDVASAGDASARPAHAEHRRGMLAGLGAYTLWGLFPLYFAALSAAGPWEILANRILWTVVACGIVLVARRQFAWVRPLLAEPRLLLGVSVAAVLIAANWVIYVNAVLVGRTAEAALGYFLNPIVTVALGVVVLRERLRPLQWAAVAIGTAAAVQLTIVGGTVPVIALSLATSFGLYGLTKNRLGVRMPALESLAAETVVLVPVAGVLLVVVSATSGLTFATAGAMHTALLVASGVVTAVPLVLFGASARRIPLALLGLLQFVTPVLQLLCAVLVLGERVALGRWIGFAIVWLALGVLAVDSLRHWSRRPGRGGLPAGH